MKTGKRQADWDWKNKPPYQRITDNPNRARSGRKPGVAWSNRALIETAFNIRVGERLKALRIQHGMKVSECRIAFGMILWRRIEQGKFPLLFRFVPNICRVFGCKFSDLIDPEDLREARQRAKDIRKKFPKVGAERRIVLARQAYHRANAIIEKCPTELPQREPKKKKKSSPSQSPVIYKRRRSSIRDSSA